MTTGKQARDNQLEDEIRQWVEVTAGQRLAASHLITGGNRHGTYALTFEATSSGQAPAGLILRISDAPGLEGQPPPLLREAAAYQALETSGVPVPRFLARHPQRQAILVTRLPGQSEFASLATSEAKEAIARQLMGCLASLHSLDPKQLSLGPLGPVKEVEAHTRLEIDSWEHQYRACGDPDPLIELALRWCRMNLPPSSGSASLLHGDVGPGNFLFDEGRVTALLDWEFAHLGDPLDDLATLSLRMVHGGMSNFPDLVEHYQGVGGGPVDAQRLTFFQVLAALRWTILRHTAQDEPLDARIASRLMSRVLHRRLLVEALAAGAGNAPAEMPALSGDATPRTSLYEAVAALLRNDVLPAVGESASGAVKSIARIVKHLATVDRMGVEAEQIELAALRSAVPEGGTSTTELRARLAEDIRTSRTSVEQALDPVTILVHLENEMLRPALGALADRPLPRLPPAAVGAEAG